MGYYVAGKKNGEGEFFYPDGSKYEGSWMNNGRHGWGRYTYPNGDTYEGEWAQDRRHGQGTYTYAQTSSRYEGTWSHGNMQDGGEFIHSNHRYIGSFTDNRPKGQGKFVFDLGCEQKGQFQWIEKETSLEDEAEEDVPEPTLRWLTEGICCVGE